MPVKEYIVNNTIKNITRILCRVDDAELDSIPVCGPLILVVNHINFIEVPLVYTHLHPRPVTGYAKAETWDNMLLRPLFNFWKAIPIKRGEADINAIRLGLQALAERKIIAIAPEGTRSGDGRLNKGFPGVVLLATLSQAPILPIAYYGGESFYNNISRFRRTNFHIRVGKPFFIKQEISLKNRYVRQQIADEIMYQVAMLLPEEYRGYYASIDKTTQEYLTFY
jgi:1-acyl-sn-glycerol-3-phosphate acyltransferase